MIGNVVKGEGFGGCVRYASSGGDYLDGNIAGRDAAEIAREMREVVAQRGEKGCTSPVRHLMMRPAPGEDLTDEEWRRAAAIMVERMGYASSPWAAYLHQHTGGRHLHVVTSLVRYDGRLVKDSFEKRRMHAVARVIEQEFCLQVVKSRGNRGAADRVAAWLGEERAEPEELRRTIDRAVQAARGQGLEGLGEELGKVGIQMRVRRNRGGMAVGVSFADAGCTALAGGSLGKEYTIGALERRVGKGKEKSTGWVGCGGVREAEMARLLARWIEPDAVVVRGVAFDIDDAGLKKLDLEEARLVWRVPATYGSGFVGFLQRELGGRSVGPVEGPGREWEPEAEALRYRAEVGAVSSLEAVGREAAVRRALGRVGRAIEEYGRAAKEVGGGVEGAAERLVGAALRVYRETGWREIPERARSEGVERAVRGWWEAVRGRRVAGDIVIPRELRGSGVEAARAEFLRGIDRVDRARLLVGGGAVGKGPGRGASRAAERVASGEMRQGDLERLGGVDGRVKVRAAEAALRAPRRREVSAGALERAAGTGTWLRGGATGRVGRTAGERAEALKEERRASAEVLREARRRVSKPESARRLLAARGARAEALCRWVGVPSLRACVVARTARGAASLARGVDTFARAALDAGLSGRAVVRAVGDSWAVLTAAGVVAVGARAGVRLAVGSIRQYTAASLKADQERER